MKTFRLFVLSALYGYCLKAQGQVPPQVANGVRPGWQEYQAIVTGMQALDVRLTLDRTDYLPGERICAKATVSNLTSAPIKAFPLTGEGSATNILLSKQATSGAPTDGGNHEYPISNNDLGNIMAGRIVISTTPGSVVTTKVCLDSRKYEITDHPILGRLSAGGYQLTLGYEESATVLFNIVSVVGSAGFASTPDSDFEGGLDPNSGIPPRCLGVGVAALETAGQTAIVAKAPIAACSPSWYANGLGTAFSGFFRVTETTSGVHSLSLYVVDDGQLKVTWVDDNKTSHQVIFGVPNGDSKPE